MNSWSRSVISASLHLRFARRLGIGAGLLYLVIYLMAIQNLVISGTDLTRFVQVPSVAVASDWTSKVFRPIAAFYFEPVAAVYPVNHLTIFFSPVNLAMGTLLGGLVAVNVAVAAYLVRTSRACGTRAYTGLLGALTGFLTGFACCVPTLAVVLGAQFTIFLIAVRSYLFPFAVLALGVSLFWNVRRALEIAPEPMLLGSVSASRAEAHYDVAS